jgi:predicted nucleotidyltransferase
MRLSERLKCAIVEAVRQSFGEVEVTLFGSRVDDDKKGGDIDLAVDSDFTHQQFRKKRAQFLSNLLYKGLDLKIDLIQLTDADALLRSEITNQGVALR